MNDPVKQSDQINMLEACAKYTDTGEPIRVFSYPNCGWDLVRSGLVTQDCKITTAGRAALFLMGKGDDPFAESKSFHVTTIPLASAAKQEGEA